ncbi:MAG: hypothetical protein EOP04_03695 [Proteobacteria bacterium]|nr:MAG: hypothetical protein EOP04_03695 [Pseudomonadota bacterium]
MKIIEDQTLYEKFLEGDLIVAEGSDLGHLLHLRVLDKTGPNFSNLKVYALCDAALAWDVHIPVSDWQGSLNGKPYCALCLMLAERKGLC